MGAYTDLRMLHFRLNWTDPGSVQVHFLGSARSEPRVLVSTPGRVPGSAYTNERLRQEFPDCSSEVPQLLPSSSLNIPEPCTKCSRTVAYSLTQCAPTVSWTPLKRARIALAVPREFLNSPPAVPLLLACTLLAPRRMFLYCSPSAPRLNNIDCSLKAPRHTLTVPRLFLRCAATALWEYPGCSSGAGEGVCVCFEWRTLPVCC